jgi:hypothetical protein
VRDHPDSIWLRRESQGADDSPTLHYDLTAPKRALAVRLGAQEVTWREIGQIVRARRQAADGGAA